MFKIRFDRCITVSLLTNLYSILKFVTLQKLIHKYLLYSRLVKFLTCRSFDTVQLSVMSPANLCLLLHSLISFVCVKHIHTKQIKTVNKDKKVL